ncbi:tetratricopeptide repeat protein [Ulvibacter sp. MAR_2010_11]|uniref:tetratricopeptide repeat protein n=1 Tax=Ulvibacter sp. MAR_2010_11 TaxID=1250229 RepID=UPI000C2C95DD|nr:tetratricopeptide repeat protein [Ulvibacter sp. MAR_2010_11]PKA82155.1 tetratricopeptide repeat protein [Ulvibacter sp. MAR_2010_11]
MRSKYFLLYILIAVLFAGQSVFAQKNGDSILTQANNLIYEDPDAAIEKALLIVDNDTTAVKLKVRGLLIISTAYTSKRDNEKSLEYVLQAEKFIPLIESETQKMTVLNRIGAQYNDLKIYDKAIDYLDESLALIQKYPQQDSIQNLLGYNSILRGFIYREQMSCDVALKYFDKAIEAYLNTVRNPIMNGNVSICYYNKGNCLLTLNKIEAAESSFLKSVEYAERINALSLIAFGQKGLAEVKTREGKYEASNTIIQNALSISENVGDLVLYRGLYYGLSNNYLALGDWENYNLYRTKFLDLQRETKLSERKSINQSLLNLAEGRANEIERLHAKNMPLQIVLICSILLSIFLLIRDVIRSEKKLKSLEKELKN